MKKAAVTVVVALALMAGLLPMLFDHGDRDLAGLEDPAPATSVSGGGVMKKIEDFPAMGDDDAARGEHDGIDQGFVFDISRLYDLSYVVDPALVEYAAGLDLSPECLIESVKEAFGDDVDFEACYTFQRERYRYDDHRIPIRTHDFVCDEREDGVLACDTVRVREHPYDNYSDDELRIMASSSAEASYLLALRLRSGKEAEFFFEQAVALSGKSGPLEDFLIYQGADGLSWHNGQLDVAGAQLNYEVSLVMETLGWPDNSFRQSVAEALLAEGEDLEPLHRRAEARHVRITERRRQLLGRDWDDQRP